MATNPEGQPALPDMEVINFIESMGQQERVDFKRQLLQEITDRQGLLQMIDDAQAGEGLEPITILY